MRTLISSLALSILFLSAGAFAGNSSKAPTLMSTAAANITVVYKNSEIPLLPPALASCAVVACVEI